MEYVRLRTAKNEIIIAPGDSCTLIVVQAAADLEDDVEEAAAAGDVVV